MFYGKLMIIVMVYTDYFKCIKNINFTNKNDFKNRHNIRMHITKYKHINFLSNNLYLKGFMYHKIVNIIHKLKINI